jgi:hypothetical protein
VIAIIGTICGCFTHRDVSPGRPFPITRSSSEDCKAGKAQACYEEGLALKLDGQPCEIEYAFRVQLALR